MAPDAVAEAYLSVIAARPDEVAAALKGRRQQAAE
jgi:hypothetical protein